MDRRPRDRGVKYVTNEEFIARYSEWSRGRLKATDEQVTKELAFVSELAKFIDPVPLRKVTKALLADFYYDYDMRSIKAHGHLEKNFLNNRFRLDAFLGELRKGIA